jgi:hypothetical protein
VLRSRDEAVGGYTRRRLGSEAGMTPDVAGRQSEGGWWSQPNRWAQGGQSGSASATGLWPGPTTRTESTSATRAAGIRVICPGRACTARWASVAGLSACRRAASVACRCRAGQLRAVDHHGSIRRRRLGVTIGATYQKCSSSERDKCTVWRRLGGVRRLADTLGQEADEHRRLLDAERACRHATHAASGAARSGSSPASCRRLAQVKRLTLG